ncbi:hypothetical protein [Chitinophaga arvensicola]|uniref:Magnesium citrate secondary transporter n=1 Tax=Chitinophaga arvensicola TaxID=29529 RepID=A0A1I0S980_9BACT|nr:hypothetical protein [Chitinophaga arvensicola]SEW52703.1 hypothetical protein SAMN04488122_5043 [Chitinophaga arvensicola]
MKRLFDPFMLTYCSAWILIHACRYFHCPIPLLNGYLTDFTAVPAIAHVSVTFIRTYILRDQCYRYPLSYLLFIAVYTAVAFEWVMPRYSGVYTRDNWDVVAYFAGGVFYYFVHGRMVGAGVEK